MGNGAVGFVVEGSVLDGPSPCGEEKAKGVRKARL